MKSLAGKLAITTALACACALPFLSRTSRNNPSAIYAAELPDAIRYAPDGSFLLPADYREWVFLSSGVDMSYQANASPTDHHVFDNVFASPSAYRRFQTTGTWPDKTVLVLEIRDAEHQPSLNKRGQTQGQQVAGIEVHVKDAGRYPGGWAFFDVGSDGRGRYLQPKEACYSCHRDHAAVDTTFVQFYPTLLPAAQTHKTLSAAYLHDRDSNFR